jgi:hypothetical protein
LARRIGSGARREQHASTCELEWSRRTSERAASAELGSVNLYFAVLPVDLYFAVLPGDLYFAVLPVDLFSVLASVGLMEPRTEPTKPTPNSSVFGYVENRKIVDSWKSKFTATERTGPILKPNAPP